MCFADFMCPGAIVRLANEQPEIFFYEVIQEHLTADEVIAHGVQV